MKRVLLLLFALLIGAPAYGQVNYVGPITTNHLPYWVANGVIGDSGTSADSPISSIGATGPICSNSARVSTGSWQQLCFQANTNSPAIISLQNYGTAPAETLQFVVNGITYNFPGSLSSITVGTTPVIGGTNSLCLYVSGGVVGQQVCTLSAITSLVGDVTGSGPGVTTATLAASGVVAGTYGSTTLVPILTVDAKGRVTSASTTSPGITVGTTVVTSGTTNGLLYDNGSVLGNLGTTVNGVLVTNGAGVPSIATTLPSGLSIPSPVITGTIVSPIVAGGATAGSTLTLESTSNGSPSGDSVTVEGTTITLQNPANATSTINLGGTAGGNVTINLGNATDGVAALNVFTSSGVKQIWVPGAGSTTVTFPSTTTTLAGLAVAQTFSSNQTFSAQGIFTGTSAPSSAAGNTVVMGTITSPTLTNTGQAYLYSTTTQGAILQGDGSTYDTSIFNKNGSLVFGVPTGTSKLNFPSLVSGTCSSGLALDSGNNLILDSCPSAAASIQVGTTTVTSGTNNFVLTSGTGTLANVTIASLLTAGAGISITGTTNATIAASLSFFSNSLGSDVAMSSTSTYFDGPSTGQGTTGTWWASGAITVTDTASIANIECKLWDGTTVIASTASTVPAIGDNMNISLSGVLATPAANIKISCKDTSATTGKILFNASGNSKDSTLVVHRIQ